MDQKFLKDIQSNGWVIEAVEEGSCIARCPSPGCGMRARIKSSGAVPPRLNDQVELDFNATSFNAARGFLRGRREELRLSIAEVEEAAGLTKDHLAKMERDDDLRIPNLETFITWANTLGFELVLRPAELPPVTMRMICDTRSLTARRGRRFMVERDRRQRGGVRGQR